MKHHWEIEPSDIENVKAFIDKHRDDLIVKRRYKRNLRDDKPRVEKETFWKQMVACLLTTQQRSGPTSAVTRFIIKKPFSLALETCLGQPNVEAFVMGILTAFRGLRRSTTLANEIARNLQLLEKKLWQPSLDALESVRVGQDIATEREVASFIAKEFAGFGPKQSRNLMQSLGLSRYETPIDSRVTKWLNRIGFPLQVSGAALSDLNYYTFVMDGFQAVCQACGVFPCVLDASIFSESDGAGWTEENMIW